LAVALVNLLVAWTPPITRSSEGPDVLASCIAHYVRKKRPGINLIRGRMKRVRSAAEILNLTKGCNPCGLILVGEQASMKPLVAGCFAKRSDIVIVEVLIKSDVVNLGVRNPGLDEVLDSLQASVEKVGERCGVNAGPICLEAYGCTLSRDLLNVCDETAALECSSDDGCSKQGDEPEDPFDQDGPGAGAEYQYEVGEAISQGADEGRQETGESNPGNNATSGPAGGNDEWSGRKLLEVACRWIQTTLRDAAPGTLSEHRDADAQSPDREVSEAVVSAEPDGGGTCGDTVSSECGSGDDARYEGGNQCGGSPAGGDGSCGGDDFASGGGRQFGGRGRGGGYGSSGEGGGDAPRCRRVLYAANRWIKSVLKHALCHVPKARDASQGFTPSPETLENLLKACHKQPLGDYCKWTTLCRKLCAADPATEPLAAAFELIGGDVLEFQLMALALAPELDVRYQLCLGCLQDDMSRRTGTLALYCALLGRCVRVRERLEAGGKLWEWLTFEGRGVPADEPLRLDPYFAQWLLGDAGALMQDPRVRRVLRLAPWLGAGVLDECEDHRLAAELRCKLQRGPARWIVLNGDDLASWRALVELGSHVPQDVHRRRLVEAVYKQGGCEPIVARRLGNDPIRVEPARLAGAAAVDVEDCARRVGRMAILTRRPLIVDAAGADEVEGAAIAVEAFVSALETTQCRAAVICQDHAAIIRCLPTDDVENVTRPPLSHEGRVAAVRRAAHAADVDLSSDEAADMANRFPLSVDALQQAAQLANGSPAECRYGELLLRRFVSACRQLSVAGLSNLAERIEPVFRIADVVLPPDRKQQFVEIVNNVRLAPKVFDGWKFGEQLPYGRGVSALFFGPSGTGKTMAAMAIARELGVQLLRIDLSRVVSKYIGDTEKNIDRVFNDAQRSGSAILIDEADALLGKRSEVKDAHDRYANIEVAYVLQRMEAYEGLAILTSNMRQNMDAAFLRRLRFIVDFPRPNQGAREQIWRFCLPEDSHDLTDEAFRQLAKKIDLTGGHIRQITLRAAFLAAAEEARINLGHIKDAARAEFAKLGMPAADIDVNVDRRAA
jgi:hypothetical protein